MAKKSNLSRKIFGDKVHARSRISNGRTLLPCVDGRSLYARRLRDLIGLHLSDLGGQEIASTAEQSIVRRASILTVELEHLEVKFASTGEASAEQLLLYGRTASTLRRLLEAIGLHRRAKPVPDLQTYLAAKYADSVDSEDADATAD